MFFKDNTLHTESEIRALYPNTSFSTPFNPADLGFEVVFDTPKPTCTSVQTVIQDGTELDSKGNRVFKYTIQNMFNTPEEETTYLAQLKKATVPASVTMRQARLALHQSNLLVQVNTAITSGTDEELKIEWEYATELKRDFPSLVILATSLSLTETQLDDLFILAGTL